MDIDISISSNVDIGNISSLRLRRSLAPSVPSLECNDGTQVADIQSITARNFTITDQLESGEKHYYYRVCIYDGLNMLAYVSEPIYAFKKGSGSALAFVISSDYKFFGGIGSLDIADQRCNEAAYNSKVLSDNVGSGWKAILSTSTVNARARLSFSGAVYNTMGQKVASNKTGLFSETLISPIVYDENGDYNNVEVWTGSTSSGLYSGASCLDFSSSSGAVYGSFGNSSAYDDAWLVAPSIAALMLSISLLSLLNTPLSPSTLLLRLTTMAVKLDVSVTRLPCRSVIILRVSFEVCWLSTACSFSALNWLIHSCLVEPFGSTAGIAECSA